MTIRAIAAAPRARTERLIVRQIEGEWLYYDLDSHKATCLNAFSARVLRLCDGIRSASDIAEAMQPDDVDEDVVNLAIEKLAKAKLLEAPYEAPTRSEARTSRRDMIRNIGAGAGTLAMVPVVSAITVPTPAQAASCLGPGAVCTSGTCCSGLQCTGPDNPKTCK
jgi:hypothetical protein